MSSTESEWMVGRSRLRGRGDDIKERPTGRNVIGLLILSVAAAVLLAHTFKLNVPGTITSLIVGGGAPASLYMTWESLRQAGKPQSKGSTPASDADTLADIVLKQWEKEYKVRTYGDPSQKLRELTVSWAAARASLAVPWHTLTEVARGPGAFKGMQPRKWAVGPRELSGFEHDLPAILEKIPTGWLVVLGGSGSGKTMLMLRTVRDLIRKRSSGDPVPVFVPVASWNPDNDSLYAWLEKQLRIDYPWLGTFLERGEERKSRIAILLDEQRIVPVLDGLDELPFPFQVAAINRLNEAFADSKRPLRLMVSCRTDDYEKAVGKPEDGRNPVGAAASIELHTLDPDKVSSYLGARGDDPRWAQVDERLKLPDSQLAKALNTPLYASLASAIYNASRVEARGKLPKPAELCDLTDVNSVHNHLLDDFIPAVYTKEREAQERRAGEDDDDDDDDVQIKRLPAERWLMILADYLTNGREDPTTSLEWWNLKGLAPRWLAPAAVGTVCGIATAIAAATGTHVGVGIGIGFGTGMLIAIALGLVVYRAHRRWDDNRVSRGQMSRKAFSRRYNKRHPGPGMTGGMIGALIGSLAAGVSAKYHIGNEASLFSGLPEGLGMAIGAGASTDFIGGLAGTLVGAFVGGCLSAIGLGLPAGLVNGVGVGLAAGLAVVTVGRQAPSRRRPEWDKKIGIAGGLVIGAAIGLIAFREEGPVLGIVFGTILAVFAALPFGLRHKDENLKFVPSPGQALARDLQAFRLTALSAGLAAGAAGFIGISMASIFEVHAKPSWSHLVGNGLGTGIASGLVIGLTFGFYHAASPEFRIVSWWLALQRKAPWRFRHFLEDAYRLTVLRQSGATYQFRHKELQQRLADRFQAEQSQRQTRRSRPRLQRENRTPRSPEPAATPAAAVGPVTDTQ